MNVPSRPTLVAALLWAWTAGLAAQSPPLVLGDETAGSPASRHRAIDYRWGSRPASFHEVTDATERPRLSGLARARLDGIEEKRFGFSSVTAYFKRVQGPEGDRSWMTSSATLQLWLVTQRGDGRRRWWRLGPAAPDGGADMFDPLSITDAPDKEVSPDDLRFASPARGAEPIVVVRYGSKMFGANSGSTTTHHLLVDSRSGVPSVLGYFDEVGYECGGACTHYMCLYAVNVAVGCRWDSSANDFICTSTLHRTDTAWFERRGTRRFRFSDGAPLPRQDQHPATDVDPAIPEAAITTKVGEASAVDGLGPVTVIADAPAGARTIRLFAAPALTWRFGVRFFAATIEQSKRGPISEIRSRVTAVDGSPVNESFEDKQDDERPNVFTPDGALPRFASSVVAREGSTTILRVAVSEGDGRGVYLVGLEDAGDRVIADAILVATDGRSYYNCGKWTVPTTAVGIAITPGPFRAMLDVEPEGLVDKEGYDAADEDRLPAERCRTAVTLSWQRGQGFSIEGAVPACEPRPGRRVRIDADGHIDVAPRAAAPPL